MGLRAGECPYQAMQRELVDFVTTKEDTNRDHDQTDHVYPMSLARRSQGEALAAARNQDEALASMDEFHDYAVLERGLDNTLPEVRDVIWCEIKQLAADGDPFAKELLEAENRVLVTNLGCFRVV